MLCITNLKHRIKLVSSAFFMDGLQVQCIWLLCAQSINVLVSGLGWRTASCNRGFGVGGRFGLVVVWPDTDKWKVTLLLVTVNFVTYFYWNVYIRHVSIRLLFYVFYTLFVRLYNLIYSLRLSGREHTIQILTVPLICTRR